MFGPHRLRLPLAVFGLAAALALPGALAARGARAADAPKPAAAEQLPADAVTHHTLNVGGQEVHYTATAGTLPLHNDKGEEQAQIFYVSFTLDGVPDAGKRPLTYAFNGGPGAASAYLDIGAIGPRALDFGADGSIPPALVHVVDNPDTWLPFTDLVFVDPVGTGYSRATGNNEEVAKHYWSVGEDIAALARIIQLHATRTGRLSSPIYLAGESYGGFRAARLPHYLATKEGIDLAGVVMISPVIDFQLMGNDQTDVLPWALRLPSLAAVTLAAQGPLDPAKLKPAEQYAMGPYLAALAAGASDPERAKQAYAEVAKLTGIDEAAIARWHGRIPLAAYVKDARRSEGKVVSRYDGTATMPDPDPWGLDAEDDPILTRSLAPFTQGFVLYVRDELDYKTDLPFALLNVDVNHHWVWHDGDGWGATGSSEALRRALALEPRLRVLIAQGMTDLQTPYMMSRLVIDQLPDAERGRVELKLYDGGHMMYLHDASRHRLAADAAAFYAGGAPK